MHVCKQLCSHNQYVYTMCNNFVNYIRSAYAIRIQKILDQRKRENIYYLHSNGHTRFDAMWTWHRYRNGHVLELCIWIRSVPFRFVPIHQSTQFQQCGQYCLKSKHSNSLKRNMCVICSSISYISILIELGENIC